MGMIKNILEYFEKTVDLVPDKIAIVDGSNSITFKQLNLNSKKNAQRLISSLSGLVNKPIAVYLPKSIEIIVANLSITYSGNIYMNLDIKSPDARIKKILDLINPSAIITNSLNIDKLNGIIRNANIINIDNTDSITFDQTDSLQIILDKKIDTDPYCIINTSGSTGTPKGVVLNHRSFIDFTDWAIETLNIGDNEVIGSLSPAVFDIYSFELCMLIAKGSTIVILPDTLAAFPAGLLNLMQEKLISFIFWVPTIMVNIANLNLLSKIPLPNLKTVWFAGEVFPTKQFNYWRNQLSNTRFVNLYGPIEITLDCTYYIVERELKDDEPIPIGFPCRNTDILILNEQNKPVGKNETGELCVRGTSLAMGYYNNPEKTGLAFIQNPLNTKYPEIIYRTGDQVLINDFGEIMFKGRKDTLIKHLGYRIELAEIEHVIINTLKLVENGCVVYDFNKKEIKLYYEAQEVLSVAEMRKAISGILPKYMIPGSFYRMKQLPRNQNGKIDRLLLNRNYTEK
jgi:amino acid adenylation domain-containing protein